MKNVRLNNGVMMPAIGFGVFQIPKNETERVVTDAIEVGYRKFDTAAAYFNEEPLGNAIRQSGIKREDLFITTKLWVQDYEYDDALRAFDLSMKKLGLDYLDLYLMHKPYGNYYAAWRAMERLYKEGRIRAIGVTSFSNERLQDLFLHNEIKPAVNQLETHPFFQQQSANEFLRQEAIQHEAWSPFAEGLNDIFNHLTLKMIAKHHDKGVGAIILRWLNQRNVVVIPKSIHKDRMIENFNIFDFTLSEEEMAAIALLETGKSPIYDDMDLATVKAIGLHTIHD
ncbi:MAG: aldo/keto reductase [Succinatimonas sp.]|nr:aldo/keto reductase [Succinatimonas sp.]